MASMVASKSASVYSRISRRTYMHMVFAVRDVTTLPSLPRPSTVMVYGVFASHGTFTVDAASGDATSYVPL
jgi:hypothetical protein